MQRPCVQKMACFGRMRSDVIAILTFVLVVALHVREVRAETSTVNLEPRPSWTTSRVVGSPEPPPPYTVEPVFKHIAWKNPVFAIREPGSNWLIVVEWPQLIPDAAAANGASGENKGPRFKPVRVVRIEDRDGEPQPELFLELKDRAIYSLAFHPRYRENGQVFVCSRTRPEGGLGTNFLSRFVVTREKQSDPSGKPACDPATEERIIEWPSEGHDGGAVVFGHDGMLYVTTGDGTTDSDNNLTAQDPGKLLGKVLRIDVDHPSGGKKYGIPADNPFLTTKGARGEIWSLGHRNPWRMTVDERTGGIWVGNNGQDLWEFAHLLKAGDNCGWSIYEGSHPFYLHRQRGPGRLAPPTIEHDHGLFRSLTGGVVYYGSRHPGLEGKYVYGDYGTGEIWGAHHDGSKVTWNKELARTTLNIVGFATSQREEILVLDYASGIYRLTESPPDDSYRRFPHKLSETGLFASVAEYKPAPGVVPYTVKAPAWSDGAVADRLVALPKDTRIERRPSTVPNVPVEWKFPEGTVVAQTLSLPKLQTGKSAVGRRIETRLLTKQKGAWAAYTYVWNEAQNEATLAPSEGMELELASIANRDDENSPRKWKVPNRTECMSCHSRQANFVLGLSEPQADCMQKLGGVEMNQLAALEQQKVVTPIDPPPTQKSPGLVNPYDRSQDLEARVRSYLHTNCSSCHVEAGGGNSRIRLNIEQKRDDMQLVDVFPQHESFGLPAALLVASGEPERSVLYHRISKRGPGQMPPRGTQVVDQEAVQMLQEWIAQLQPKRKLVKDYTMEDIAPSLRELDHGRSFETGGRLFKELGCIQCHRFAGTGGGAGPDLTGITKKHSPRELLESIVDPSKQIAPEFAATIIVTSDGKTIEGRIAKEDDDQVVLHLAGALGTPVVIRNSEIESRKLSTTSTMPNRLLNTLEIPEILDLLAYIVADGDPKHGCFQAAAASSLR